MPLIDDHSLQSCEARREIGLAEEKRETLRRRDKRLAGIAPDFPFAVCGHVPRPAVHAPVDSETVQRFPQICLGVGGKRAHGRDPQNPEAPVRPAARRTQSAEPHRKGFSTAGGGVEQARGTCAHQSPHSPLKSKR